jgi:hypothetical protein
MGRTHCRTHGYKLSLLKVGKRKYKEEHGGALVGTGGTECVLLLLRYFLNL